MEAYYYNRLDKERQGIYQQMLIGLRGMEDMILLPKTDIRVLGELFFYLRLDHPELFYAVTFRCRSYQGSSNVQMIPEYLFEKTKIKEQQKAMTARVDKLVRQAPKGSEEEKEQYIHDFICQNVTYDKLKKPYSHEIIGPLGHGVGVCEGIAKSVKILCNALGIWCIIAVSEANPEKNIKYRHAWNIVKINGKYVHLDVTFDNTLGKREIRYDYFNLDDKSIFRDHEPVIIKTPVCDDHTQFYYLKKKLSFTKMEEVQKRALQAAKKGKLFTFHWRGGYLTREVLQEILQCMQEIAASKQKHLLVSLNWPQAVIQVSFETEQPKQAVTMEEANEGELYEEEA